MLEIARGRAKVLVELKYYGYDVDLEARTAHVIERAQMADQIAIMSLKYPAMLKMQELRPDWRTRIDGFGAALVPVAGRAAGFVSTDR